jgi:hypothetical protein
MTTKALEMKPDTMGSHRIGLIMFWIGAVLVFVTGWLVMWWVFPIWKNSPVEQFEGTIFAFLGPVYMTIALNDFCLSRPGLYDNCP